MLRTEKDEKVWRSQVNGKSNELIEIIYSKLPKCNYPFINSLNPP